MALVPISKGQLTVDNTAGGVGIPSSEVTPNVIMALCRVSTAEIRVSTSAAPTSSTGIPVQPGEVFKLWGHPSLKGFRGIRTGSVSGVIDYELYGDRSSAS